MSYAIKFPLRLKIEDVKRLCKIPERATISLLKKGNKREIRVETWEELVAIHRDVSLGLSSVLCYEIRDEETGERVDADVVAAQWGWESVDRYPQSKLQKLEVRCRQKKLRPDVALPERCLRRKRQKK